MRDWGSRPAWLRFLEVFCNRIHEMTLLVSLIFLCLWLNLRRRRPNRDVQVMFSWKVVGGGCDCSSEEPRVQLVPKDSVPDVELIT